MFRVSPGLVQLLDLPPGQGEVFGEHQQQRRNDRAAPHHGHHHPLVAEAVDDGINGPVGHEGNEIPLRVGQPGAVQMPPLPLDGGLPGVFLVLVHGLLEFPQILLRGTPIHIFIDVIDPVKIILPVGIGAADDIRAIPADDKGVHMLVILIQGQGIVDVRHRQPRHQGDAVFPICGPVLAGDPQEHHVVPRLVCADGHLLIPLHNGLHKGVRVGDL